MSALRIEKLSQPFKQIAGFVGGNSRWLAAFD
jgi:hypothetical protein